MKTSQLSSMPIQPSGDNDRWSTLGFYFFMGAMVFGMVLLLLAPLFL